MIRRTLLLAPVLTFLIAACGNDGVADVDGDEADRVALVLRGPAEAHSREIVTLGVRVQPIGGSLPTGTTVEMELAEGAAIQSLSHDGRAEGSTVVWSDLPALVAGDSLVLTVDAMPPLVGPFTTSASASWGASGRATANTLRTLLTFVAAVTLEGDRSGSQFGWEMENLGDVDGDGAGDFAVSAPASSRVVVYSGRDGSTIHEFSVGSRTGIDMSAVDDVDQDGAADLIVGAPGFNAGPGEAFVLSTATGQVLHRFSEGDADDQFGWSTAPLEDVDGDGHIDYVVGASEWDAFGAEDAGRIYLFSGGSGTLIRTVDLQSLSTTSNFPVPVQAGANFGHAVGAIDDVDGDGIVDFAVGAPGVGAVFLLSGADGSLLIAPIRDDGEVPGLGAFWISSAGDFDGDGLSDIFASNLNVGGGSQTVGRGRSYVFSSADGTAIARFDGESQGDQFGVGHPAGDLDGDSVGDLIIAAWLRTEGATQAGKVYVISGRTRAVLQTFTGVTEGQRLGFDAVVVDDLNGDGNPDFVLSGNVLPLPGQSGRGNVYVVHGKALK